jgi:DNA-binding protein H-NS
MPRETFAVTIEKWGRFVRHVNETGIEIPGTGSVKDELEEMYRRARQLVQERAALEAASQAATRELQEILEQGRIKHNMLRQSLKVHLGYGNEELTAYDIRPFRGQSRRSKNPASEE